MLLDDCVEQTHLKKYWVNRKFRCYFEKKAFCTFCKTHRRKKVPFRYAPADSRGSILPPRSRDGPLRGQGLHQLPDAYNYCNATL